MLPVLDAGLPAPARGLFTTRAGGVSVPPWDALNLSWHVEDEGRAVLTNRDVLDRQAGGAVHWPQQVHGCGVLVVDETRAGRRRVREGGAPGVDALVTALPGVPLGVLAADCLPVLLCDPGAGVVAAAHAGRVGLAAGVLQATVEAMVGLGAEPARTQAVIGPAICGRCYEVPAGMQDEVAAAVPGAAAGTSRGTASLDLPAGAVRLLRGLGLAAVTDTGVCTLEDPRFYSYRRDGLTGRHAGVVVLDRPARPS